MTKLRKTMSGEPSSLMNGRLILGLPERIWQKKETLAERAFLLGSKRVGSPSVDACDWRFVKLLSKRLATASNCRPGMTSSVECSGQEPWQRTLAKCGSFSTLHEVAATVYHRRTCGSKRPQALVWKQAIALRSANHRAVISRQSLGAQAHACRSSSSRRPSGRATLAPCVCPNPPRANA